MRDDVTIWYRGASYELGRGPGFYGIWTAGTHRAAPVQWWPETAGGWSGAWSRFTWLEPTGTIVSVAPPAAGAAGPADPDPSAEPARTTAIIGAALLILGVGCGIAGLFPAYLSGASLAGQPENLLPHVLYLAVWAAGAALILLGGGRRRVGALVGLGTAVVAFGLFLADIGQVIAGGAHLAGAGLVLGLVGWLDCTVGSALALWRARAGAPVRPRGLELGPVILTLLAGLGVAIAFIPSWDSYVLRTSAGLTQSVTAGYAFGNPAPVIAGYVALMIALMAAVVGAALWRPARYGAALLAGAVIPMAAQAISALIGVGEPVSPALLGISPARAGQLGLTISSGLTPAFWIYCVFLVALILAGALMLATPAAAARSRQPAVPRPGAPSLRPATADPSSAAASDPVGAQIPPSG